MSRKTSRLEKIVRIRDRELSRAKAELAGQLRERSRAESEYERQRGQLANGARMLEERLHAGTTGGAMQLAACGIDATRFGVREAAERRDACEQPIVQSRAAVTKARQRLRALEIISERMRAEARKRREKRAQRDLDEVGSRMTREPRGRK